MYIILKKIWMILSGLFLGMSLLLFNIYSPDHSLDQTYKIYNFQIILIVLAVFSLCTAQLGRLMVINISIFCILLIPTAMGLEWAILQQPTRAELVQKQWEFSKDEEGNVFNRLYYAKQYNNKNSDFKLYPFLSYLDFFDEYGFFSFGDVPNARIVYCNEGFVVTSLTDEMGFRNKSEIYVEETFQYITVGDSFVHGFCVNDDQIIGEQISRKLETKVLNLGLAGTGIHSQFAILKTLDENTLRGKKVLWFIYEGNDLEDFKRERSLDFETIGPAEKNLRELKIGLAEARMEASIPLKPHFLPAQRSHILRFTKLRDLLGVDTLVFDRTEDELVELVHEIATFGEKHDIAFGFYIIPTLHRYTTFGGAIKYESVSNLFETALGELGYRPTLLDSEFKKYEYPAAFYPRGKTGHLNNLGYAILADLVVSDEKNR